MKRLVISLLLLSVTVCAHAQLFDFSSNDNRYEAGLNFGQMAFNTQYARFGMGLNMLAWGVYAFTRYAVYGGFAIDIDSLVFRN